MQWYEAEVQHLERQSAPAGAVLFYGSSSIRLWATLESDFPFVDLVNRGFGGSTLEACVYFFDRLVSPIAPRSIVFYAGDNDLGDGRSPEQVCSDFGALLRCLDRRVPTARFAFLAIKPSPARDWLRDRIDFVHHRVRSELAARPRSLFVDVHTPMLDAQGRPRRALFAEDGLHLSPSGYALWRDVLWAQQREIF